MTIRRRLNRLEGRGGGRVPFRIFSYGLEDDGLYREGEKTFTAAEFAELEKSDDFQIILVQYGQWRTGETPQNGRQMTWGDPDDDD